MQLEKRGARENTIWFYKIIGGKDEINREKIFAVFLKKIEMKSEGEYFKIDRKRGCSHSNSKAVKLLCTRENGTQLAEVYTE